MLVKPELACLLIADIAGYTDYLAGVELDHAQDILADLVDTVVGRLRPTFRLAKLEGDAPSVPEGSRRFLSQPVGSGDGPVDSVSARSSSA